LLAHGNVAGPELFEHATDREDWVAAFDRRAQCVPHTKCVVVRPKQVFAAVVSLWLVVCAITGARHAALVGHVVDRATGAIVHGTRLASAHAAPQSDVHAPRDRGDDHGDACELATALHQPARAAATPPLSALAARWIELAPVTCDRTAVASHDVYRLAPKTSPPAHS
jgi:hypothetical protein